MKKLLFILCVVICFAEGNAQDRQFSQFSASPLNLNPALTGNNACDWRVGTNLRSEWLGVNSSFFLGSIIGDVAVGKIKNKKANFAGIGILGNFDNAGQLNYRTTDAYLSAAYHLVLGKRANSALSFGIQGGIRYYSFDIGKIILNENIDFITGAITQNNSVVTNSNAIIPDANFGMLYNYKKNDKFGYYIGAAGFHIPQASYTFTSGTSSEILRFKFSSHAGMNIGFGDHFSIMPQVIWMWQNSFIQWRVGTYAKYTITDVRKSKKTVQAVYLGAWFWKSYLGSKMSAAVKYDYGNLTMALSYDFDISKLSSLSSMGGAPELSITYTGCFRRNNNKFGCPVVL